MDLELVQQEAPCGAFFLDILARDLNRGRAVVVIENQLEPTDHEHLGKLLTYAAGHNATAVIWIAEEIREEHRQALDWLNQHTDEDLEFFGVVVEVIRIDESKPACIFRPVAFPNVVRKGVVSEATSPKKEKYRLFFQRLIDELRESHNFTGAKVAQAQNWYAFSTGYGGCHYLVRFEKDGNVRTWLRFVSGDALQNKKLFDHLHGNKKEIEGEYGASLEWDTQDGRQECGIAVSHPGAIHDPAASEEVHKWAVDQLLRFSKIFGPRLAKLHAEGQV